MFFIIGSFLNKNTDKLEYFFMPRHKDNDIEMNIHKSNFNILM